jgi:16S rRNA (adenine1518-N6/adenine1519-N6)-dimethyltransferase
MGRKNSSARSPRSGGSSYSSGYSSNYSSGPTLGRRRAFGQHFLKDKSVCNKIADAAIELAISSGSEGLLEIGPGRGAITEPLIERLSKLPKLSRFLICEKDRALAARWNVEAGLRPLLQILDADFLELSPASWLPVTPLTVVSNLPYSAGTAIFTRLASHPKQIPAMVLMFQSEVAQRLRAERNTKAWGTLSIWTQNRWDVKKLLSVPPSAFNPPPQVQSEVVILTPRETPRIPQTDGVHEKVWEGLLKACFQHRRKMLRSGLPKSGPLRNALELSGVDDTKRAEALDWMEWEKLYRALPK